MLVEFFRLLWMLLAQSKKDVPVCALEYEISNSYYVLRVEVYGCSYTKTVVAKMMCAVVTIVSPYYLCSNNWCITL